MVTDLLLALLAMAALFVPLGFAWWVLSRTARRHAGAAPQERPDAITCAPPMHDDRPDPDALIAQLRNDEARARAASCASTSAPAPAWARPGPC
jgi:hypothetical protein